MTICIYCDNTGLFTEKELEDDNLTDMNFPEEIVRQWYEDHKKQLVAETADELNISESDVTFDLWFNQVCWAEDVDGLYDYSVSKGHTPSFDVGGEYVVVYTKNNIVHEIYKGDYDHCLFFRRDYDFKFNNCNLKIIKSEGR